MNVWSSSQIFHTLSVHSQECLVLLVATCERVLLVFLTLTIFLKTFYLFNPVSQNKWPRPHFYISRLTSLLLPSSKYAPLACVFVHFSCCGVTDSEYAPSVISLVTLPVTSLDLFVGWTWAKYYSPSAIVWPSFKIQWHSRKGVYLPIEFYLYTMWNNILYLFQEYKTHRESFLKRFELTKLPPYLILYIKVSGAIPEHTVSPILN